MEQSKADDAEGVRKATKDMKDAMLCVAFVMQEIAERKLPEGELNDLVEATIVRFRDAVVYFACREIEKLSRETGASVAVATTGLMAFEEFEKSNRRFNVMTELLKPEKKDVLSV